ncbi:MAG: APC family permease [Methanobacteriota archaeon]|nr:MAG: APC family permease [Euryarchaeota archaeon]
MPLTSARRKGRGSTGDADVDVFARRGATATGEVQVFTRRASGLVRVMSPYSAFAYNVLNIGVIFPWVYITTLSVFPNANVWAGIIVTGIFTGFLAVVYAGLASAMPRTGGDYVFQSRTLKPWLGFAIVSTMIITFFLQWQALGGWLVAVLGLSPMFLGLGLTTGNTMFIDWGIWFATPFGAMVTTMVTSTIAALVLIKSFRWFVKIQWVMWYGFLLSFVLMAVMFFLTPQATFIARYDRATQVIIGSSGLTYQQLLSTYFTPTTELSWVATLLVAPVALTSLGWVGYAQEQAGEIQGAQSLRSQMFINLGGGLFSMVLMAILSFAMIRTVGQDWLSAAAGASFVTQPAPLPMIAPWFSNLAMMLTDNPIILFLMIVGVLLNALQVVFNVIIGWTRVAVAMSIDGVLPKAVSHVSPRTHTPVIAHVIFLILGGYVYAYIYNMVPGYLTYTLAVTAVATVMYIGTAVGGASFPKTRREVYRTSPIAKYKVGPIPVITICGVIAAAFSAWMLFYYITEPFLGIANLTIGFDGLKSLLIMLAIFIGWTVYYFVRRAYLKSVGISLDLAYKEIPPI